MLSRPKQVLDLELLAADPDGLIPVYNLIDVAQNLEVHRAMVSGHDRSSTVSILSGVFCVKRQLVANCDLSL
jgi:hypothetical protein